MRIEFHLHDQNDRFKSIAQQKRFEKYLIFFESELLELYKNLSKSDLNEISIKLLDASELEKEASCTRNSIRENEFLIKMVFCNKYDVIEKFAHELCHVMQYISGRVVTIDSANGILAWEGQEYHLDELQHNKCPWEIEAIKNGMKLYSNYLATVNSGANIHEKS